MARGEIIILAAIAEKNQVIGKDGKLPWYISEDLKRFKRLTTGYPVLMGRKTFESIVERLGKPLPDRRNIVLTSKSFAHYPDVETYPAIESALAAISSEQKIFVIGHVEAGCEDGRAALQIRSLEGTVVHRQRRATRGGRS